MFGELDQTQAIGQVFQHLVLLHKAINRLQAENIKLANQVNALSVTLYNLKDTVDELAVQIKLPSHKEATRGHKKKR